MLSTDFIGALEHNLKQKITNYKPISGGDIAEAYYFKTKNKEYFVKTHSNYALLEAEFTGLNKIAITNTIATPKTVALNCFKNKAFLILDLIPAKSPTSKDYLKLGKKLAELHQCANSSFGFDAHNFIGHLTQSNTFCDNWNDFYVDERLVPQMQLARENGALNSKEIPDADTMKSICFKYFNHIKPSLLHGDLWSGNYIISSSGEPYLIDPAVYYGHNEVDIAMSKLFGGFGHEFYNSYFQITPKDRYTETRIQLYQLYYLLVHLNLFGKSYYPSVKQILRTHFLL